jgi:hypothetical protein
MIHEITTDGKTIWVNGEISLLGRFGLFGVDIHRPLTEQQNKGECLFCTHGKTARRDWELFKIGMKHYFDITVTDKYMPEKFRNV